jgi:demethylmenaquinone methyltransferase/2-methoxy-6-polyprenyl-1,4-benzoquinol methylase
MTLMDDVTRYYAARAPVYEETAGYSDPEAERLRDPIKARYRKMFRGLKVLEVACGTGYWTRVVGEAAASVLGIDINQSLVSIAEERCRQLSNVTFQLADAYTLDGVPTGFTAALAIWWWSHVPKSELRKFLTSLHSKLRPGAFVLFCDQLPHEGPVRRQDADGNNLELRSLPDGRSFEIVKNFPSEQDVSNALAGIVENVQYTEYRDETSWNVTYNTKA